MATSSMLSRLADRVLTLVGLDFAIELRWDARFDRVADGLYVGVRPVPEDLVAFREEGITDVVSCLPEERRDEVAFLTPHVNARFFALRDTVHEDIAARFSEFVSIVDESRARSGKLLVHCEVGVSRSATLAIAYVMTTQRLGFYDAYLRVRSERTRVLPNVGFASQLYRLERSLGIAQAGEPSSLARYLKEVCKVPVAIDVLQSALARHEDDAFEAIASIFGDIPRVVQGVRR